MRASCLQMGICKGLDERLRVLSFKVLGVTLRVRRESVKENLCAVSGGFKGIRTLRLGALL